MDLLDDDRLLDLRPRARRTDAAAVIAEERARAAPLPEANEDLRSWSPPDEAPPSPARDAARGPCSVCQARAAATMCPGCGQGVCTADRWSLLGLCKRCTAEVRR
jgi:hypothetical protein